jgi:hypothetical protein
MDIPSFKQKCFDFLTNPENIKVYLPTYHGLSAKQIYKMVHFETFDPRISEYVPRLCGTGRKTYITVLFDYSNRDRLRGKARTIAVDI